MEILEHEGFCHNNQIGTPDCVRPQYVPESAVLGQTDYLGHIDLVSYKRAMFKDDIFKYRM